MEEHFWAGHRDLRVRTGKAEQEGQTFDTRTTVQTTDGVGRDMHYAVSCSHSRK
jgi:hypothetical protein